MKLIRTLIRRWQNRPPLPGSPERLRLHAALERSDAAEERLSALLMQSSPVPVDPDAVVEQILSLRESRVEIMRKLGWSDMADELAADTAMRRGWIADPPTLIP